MFTPPMARTTTAAPPTSSATTRIASPLCKPWTAMRSPALARGTKPISACKNKHVDPAFLDDSMDRTIEGNTTTTNIGNSNLRHRDSAFAPPWGLPLGPNNTPPPPSPIESEGALLSQPGYPGVVQGAGGTKRRWGTVTGARLGLRSSWRSAETTPTGKGISRQEAWRAAHANEGTGGGAMEYNYGGDGVSSASFRLQQHVDQFVDGNGISRADGRRFTQLLQLELRDVVRRGMEAETEAACLRERLRQVTGARLDREAADRHSLAGMALAHADASAELRSRLEASDGALETSEMGKRALLGDLDARGQTISDLERKVAELQTSVDVAHEGEMRALRKNLDQHHRQEMEKVRLVWEQRLSTAEEAYVTARRRWEGGEATPSCREPHIALNKRTLCTQSSGTLAKQSDAHGATNVNVREQQRKTSTRSFEQRVDGNAANTNRLGERGVVKMSTSSAAPHCVQGEAPAGVRSPPPPQRSSALSPARTTGSSHPPNLSPTKTYAASHGCRTSAAETMSSSRREPEPSQARLQRIASWESVSESVSESTIESRAGSRRQAFSRAESSVVSRSATSAETSKSMPCHREVHSNPTGKGFRVRGGGGGSRGGQRHYARSDDDDDEGVATRWSQGESGRAGSNGGRRNSDSNSNDSVFVRPSGNRDCDRDQRTLRADRHGDRSARKLEPRQARNTAPGMVRASRVTATNTPATGGGFTETDVGSSEFRSASFFSDSGYSSVCHDEGGGGGGRWRASYGGSWRSPPARAEVSVTSNRRDEEGGKNDETTRLLLSSPSFVSLRRRRRSPPLNREQARTDEDRGHGYEDVARAQRSPQHAQLQQSRMHSGRRRERQQGSSRRITSRSISSRSISSSKSRVVGDDFSNDGGVILPAAGCVIGSQDGETAISTSADVAAAAIAAAGAFASSSGIMPPASLNSWRRSPLSVSSLSWVTDVVAEETIQYGGQSATSTEASNVIARADDRARRTREEGVHSPVSTSRLSPRGSNERPRQPITENRQHSAPTAAAAVHNGSSFSFGYLSGSGSRSYSRSGSGSGVAASPGHGSRSVYRTRSGPHFGSVPASGSRSGLTSSSRSGSKASSISGSRSASEHGSRSGTTQGPGTGSLASGTQPRHESSHHVISVPSSRYSVPTRSGSASNSASVSSYSERRGGESHGNPRADRSGSRRASSSASRSDANTGQDGGGLSQSLPSGQRTASGSLSRSRSTLVSASNSRSTTPRCQEAEHPSMPGCRKRRSSGSRSSNPPSGSSASASRSVPVDDGPGDDMQAGSRASSVEMRSPESAPGGRRSSLASSSTPSDLSASRSTCPPAAEAAAEGIDQQSVFSRSDSGHRETEEEFSDESPRPISQLASPVPHVIEGRRRRRSRDITAADDTPRSASPSVPSGGRAYSVSSLSVTSHYATNTSVDVARVPGPAQVHAALRQSVAPDITCGGGMNASDGDVHDGGMQRVERHTEEKQTVEGSFSSWHSKSGSSSRSHSAVASSPSRSGSGEGHSDSLVGEGEQQQQHKRSRPPTAGSRPSQMSRRQPGRPGDRAEIALAHHRGARGSMASTTMSQVAQEEEEEEAERSGRRSRPRNKDRPLSYISRSSNNSNNSSNMQQSAFSRSDDEDERVVSSQQHIRESPRSDTGTTPRDSRIRRRRSSNARDQLLPSTEEPGGASFLENPRPIHRLPRPGTSASEPENTIGSVSRTSSSVNDVGSKESSMVSRRSHRSQPRRPINGGEMTIPPGSRGAPGAVTANISRSASSNGSGSKCGSSTRPRSNRDGSLTSYGSNNSRPGEHPPATRNPTSKSGSRGSGSWDGSASVMSSQTTRTACLERGGEAPPASSPNQLHHQRRRRHSGGSIATGHGIRAEDSPLSASGSSGSGTPSRSSADDAAASAQVVSGARNFTPTQSRTVGSLLERAYGRGDSYSPRSGSFSGSRSRSGSRPSSRSGSRSPSPSRSSSRSRSPSPSPSLSLRTRGADRDRSSSRTPSSGRSAPGDSRGGGTRRQHQGAGRRDGRRSNRRANVG